MAISHLPQIGTAGLRSSLSCSWRMPPWSEPRVRSFRNHHEIEVFREGELAERGEITLLEAAQRLVVAPMTVHRMVTLGRLQAKQVCRGAPWVLKAADVAEFAIMDNLGSHKGKVIRKLSAPPVPSCSSSQNTRPTRTPSNRSLPSSNTCSERLRRELPMRSAPPRQRSRSIHALRVRQVSRKFRLRT